MISPLTALKDSVANPSRPYEVTFPIPRVSRQMPRMHFAIWRNTDPKFAISGLIVAAYNSGSDMLFRGDAYPLEEHRASIKAADAAGLLAECEEAIKSNDKGRASAAIQIYGEKNCPVDAVFQTLIKYTISEDGRLHGEKYFHTVGEEYKTTRSAFRWGQLVGLARVTATSWGYNRKDKHGFHAPGYEDACRLLGVTT